MGKISKLILAGISIYAVKYYLENPKKIDEHKEILKEKIDNSIGYTKCMWKYTQKNGISASVEYLKDDLEKVVKRNLEKVNEKIDNTVEFGKQLAEDTNNIKENAIDIKEKSIILTSNIADATKVLKEEITPAFNNYINEVKDIVTNINNKTEDLKNAIEEENIQDKISNFTEQIEITSEENPSEDKKEN